MNILDELFSIYEEENNSNSINESWKKCSTELNGIPEHSIDRVTNLIHDYARECEKTSFANGFYYGVQLILECINKSGAFNS